MKAISLPRGGTHCTAHQEPSVFKKLIRLYCVIRTRKRQAFADSETNNLSRVFRQTDNSCNRNSALFNEVARFSLAIHFYVHFNSK